MNAQRPRIRALFAVAVAAIVSACASAPPAPTSIALPSTSTARLAIAHVTGASGSLVSGTLRLVPSGNGVRITGAIGGLAPGSRHGLHVHVNGDCSTADALAAGDVFMPPTVAPARGRHAHAADGSDIVADADGVAHVDQVLAQRALGGGFNDIAGRALVVHALPDAASTAPREDLRIGCGVIVVVPAP
jgi:superoxide dismutase, Cu-Zn family